MKINGVVKLTDSKRGTFYIAVVEPVQSDKIEMTKEQLEKLFVGGFRISHKMFTGIGYYKDETNWKNWSSDKEMWEAIKLYFESTLKEISGNDETDFISIKRLPLGRRK